jgi:hypothetical protein
MREMEEAKEEYRKRYLCDNYPHEGELPSALREDELRRERNKNVDAARKAFEFYLRNPTPAKWGAVETLASTHLENAAHIEALREARKAILEGSA